MLDLQFICDHADEVAKNCRDRGVTADIDKIVQLRQRRGEVISAGDKLRHEHKESSSKIPQESDAAKKQALIAHGKELKQKIAANEAELRDLEAELYSAQSLVPNMTHPDAPVGNDDDANRIVRQVGEIPKFDFPPLSHVELAEKHDLIDLEAGSRVAGHGFYYLKNEAVLMEMALIQFAMQKVAAAGFTLHTTPDLARDTVLEGIGFIPRGPEAQIYSVEKTDLSLVATAEITLGGMFKDQILDTAKLPIKVAGLSHCFRTEAGAHGAATRGIYRVHQFTKVEMFVVSGPDQSDAIHDEIVAIEEDMFQSLGIPYQVVDTATGDLGGPAYRKYDLEAWMPGRGEAGTFGEVTSASNCTDYQARRLAIRYKSPDTKGTHIAHTLNGTAVAVTRALIAIWENYQQADGSIIIPEVLRPWVGKDRIGGEAAG
ncbi:Serine--tRNA ligase [Symmachiella dynata]|uniref:serine--tRNA ligase n=1 Tax=Symmachiella dynata TaxID=2527995 RepID=UPI00118CBE2E|nr:serine--tRNA ligase [Symmachiella dynata]QDT46483.1 Serine--tRNA ligase [Symmachiella dynata]